MRGGAYLCYPCFQARSEQHRPTQQITSRAIRRGELVRQPCEVCGNPRSHAHHDDYSKPLEVRWLCAGHHKRWHCENRHSNKPWSDQPKGTATS
jgi:hypothetical protein